MASRSTACLRVLVCNRSDPASVNLRDRLLEVGTWEEAGRTFRGAPVWSRSEATLVEVAGPVVTDEQLDADLRATNWHVLDVWILSKHVAKSGHPSLTVHPIGNHAQADFGGHSESLSPAAARDMGALLRRMRHHAKAAGLPHSVTYESTHHGPGMTLPTLFIEIGSDAQWYGDPASGRVVAAAMEDVLSGEGRCAGPVLVGVGGGHYVPRHTDLGAAGKADFGQFLPSHFVDEADDAGGKARLARAIAATPDCEGVYVHKKGLKGGQRQAVMRWCAELGVEVVSLGSDD